MTYKQLLAALKNLERNSPAALNARVCVVGGTETPLYPTHTEFNDGSLEGVVGKHQLVLMTV